MTGSALLALALATAPVARAAAPGDPRLEVVLDRDRAWVGEEVRATLRIVTSRALDGSEVLRGPRLDGFWSEDAGSPATLAFTPLREGEALLRAYPLRRLALAPLRAGTLAIAGAEAEVRLSTAAGAPERVRLRAPPVSLLVRALPPGAPEGFSGAVGRLRLELSADPPRPRAGEPFTVRLALRGSGSLRSIVVPALPAVPGTRAFPGRLVDVPGPAGRPQARVRETPLVSDDPGALEIAAPAVPFFDPGRGAYEVARAPALRIDVLPPAPELPPPPARPPEPRRVPALPLAVAALALAVAVLAGLVLAARRRRRTGADPEAFARAAIEALERGEGGSAAALARALSSLAPAPPPRAVAEALRACDAARFGGELSPRALAGLGRRALEALRAPGAR